VKLTSRERISRILNHQPVDRIGVFEHFWSDTYNSYVSEGHIPQNEMLELHFGLDMKLFWSLNLVADLDFVQEVVAETEDTITIKDGNGAILKRHKKHDSTPEHVGFSVTCREEWMKIRHFFLEPDERRINFAVYRAERAQAMEHELFFCMCGVNVFEAIHPICGHENLLFGMADDPEWIDDMVQVLSSLIVKLQKILFEREGIPDGIWYYEDLGYKNTPFMSPTMYREIIMPGHVATFDFAHSLKLPVIIHSCGFVEPLIPHLIEAGMDCLQVIEIKAGMDLLRIYEQYGEQIALIGGIDVRVLYTNDREAIDRELEEKLPIVKKGFGYVMHSDHSIPKTVDYDTFRYYLQKGIELGTYD